MNRVLQNPVPSLAAAASHKRYSAVYVLAIMFMSMLPSAANGQGWYNNSWSFRKAITIDACKVGAGTHVNFPLLINRADADLRVNAQADADDLLFTLSDGTTNLSHEIESYISSSGTLVAARAVRQFL